VSAGVRLVLGREGVGDEQDFAEWVAFVCAHIDERAGLDVDVDVRGERDVQDDQITGADDEQRAAIAEAKRDLWDEWCAQGAPGVQS